MCKPMRQIILYLVNEKKNNSPSRYPNKKNHSCNEDAGDQKKGMTNLFFKSNKG